MLEPFGQVRNGPYVAAEGVGLGLPIAKSITEMHGAVFEIGASETGGTSVTLSFPKERVTRLDAEKAPARVLETVEG